MSSRTGTTYKAGSPGEVAPACAEASAGRQRTEAQSLGGKVNVGIVQQEFTFLSGETPQAQAERGVSRRHSTTKVTVGRPEPDRCHSSTSPQRPAKATGGERPLGIPTVLDRVIQQAIAQVIGPLFDPHFSTHSYNQLVELDQWLRRRVRLCYWKQWKRPRTRRRHLLALGISKDDVKLASRSRKGSWRMAGNSIVQRALTKQWLWDQGVPHMRQQWVDLHYPEPSCSG